jgi:isoquinoline 1-oxidoreductase alpha subunit
MKLRINGTEHDLAVAADMPLLWVLRDLQGLTGTKFGCGAGLCGACMVLVDDAPVRACLANVGDLAGKSVVTIEALEATELGQRIQSAWLAEDVVQCGYCQSGQIISAYGLLATSPNPDDAAIDAAMAGNLCRCGTYQRIRKAIKRAAGHG